MSIIQQIREKAAWLVFGLIALSLVGFLLMDAFVGRSRLFGNRSTVVGTVNGEKIEFTDFEKAMTDQEDQLKARGYQVNDAMLQNVRDMVWRQLTEDVLLNDDISSLGIQVTDKEVNDMLVGQNAIQDIKQAFTDPKTGVFDVQAAAAQINQLRNLYKSGPKKNADNSRYEMARKFFEESLPQIIKMRMREKFTALFANSAYVPKWMLEKTNSDNSQLATISFVSSPYLSVPDSAAKISDAEIQDYINKHPDQYKQEESRSIAYVTFNAGPNASDSQRVKQQLTELEPDFKKAEDIDAFFGRVGSSQPYYNGYVGKARIMVPNKDSIFALSKGELYGPYLDAGSYVVAKLVDVKTLPDSAKARHILIATSDPRTGQVINEDSVAKKRIDSVKEVLEHGGNWDSVALKVSDDPGSKEKGGLYDWFTSDRMVKEFSDFVFNGKKGEAKIVKTQFGYHYIQILDQKNFEPAYKVAYLSRKIDASQETDQAAFGLASQFAGQSRDAKAFDENVQKQGLNKMIAPDIAPAESNIPGLGTNRQLVQWAYKADIGTVSEPYTVGDRYVVAELVEINKAGMMTPAKARNQVEPILRRKKKAELLARKFGNPASLDAAASASGQPVQHADSLRFASGFIPNVGQEPKVVGASFDKQLSGKAISPAIAGNAGLFFIKVDNVSAMSNPNADVQQQRLMQEQMERQLIDRGLTETMRKRADIKDYRSNFF
ncbi:MAG TPA: peptidylprolyl isomerase [Puia sp.]|uniref:peptidylprolyl isomerase n=1 Tax=Puia sp. TaxID=2045100 RepID=UPI002C3A7EF2|nr:peptidylprolyl isomerase [Puia sp.]HVU97214.1 peptidylprolyl isomerase [Puia sp.]